MVVVVVVFLVAGYNAITWLLQCVAVLSETVRCREAQGVGWYVVW